MKDNSVWIPRENDDEAPHFHSYPYSDLPHLVSHIHPKFAIFDAGRILKGLGNLTPKHLRNVLNDNRFV